MTTIDNRIVGLGFENRSFEAGVKDSLDSLTALKKGLNFDGALSSLGGLQGSVRGFDVSVIGNALNSISERFSLFGLIGMSVINNLTGSIMRFGQRMVNDLLVPMRAGMAEYELQMDSIQTILANTSKDGTKLADVTGALDELNAYADKTIYNFGQMTKNIGTFTAAGVKLDTSVQAIKGIANLAALSGSNAQQASTAMYQLSQAISSGTVRLMDWNSVVNAGMGGKVFQDALMETARVNGIAIDQIMKKQGGFRNSLQTGWLSSEIMLQTLAKFTGDLTEAQLLQIGYTKEQATEIMKMGVTASDAATKVKTFSQLKDTLAEARQSGWAKTFQLIVGDFEQAKALFTRLSDILGGFIGRTADARNETVRMWATFGGRENLLNALFNAFDTFAFVAKLAGDAFRKFFPERPVWYDILKITRAIESLSRALYGEGLIHAGEISRIFAGFFAVLRIGWDVVKGLAEGLYLLFSTNVSTKIGLLEGLAKIGDFLVNLQKNMGVQTFLTGAFKVLNERVQSIRTELDKFVLALKERLGSLKEIFRAAFSGIDLSPIKDLFNNLFSGVKIGEFKPFESLLKGFSWLLLNLLDLAINFGPRFLSFAGNAKEVVSNFIGGIAQALSETDFTKIFSSLNAGLFASILLAIKNFITSGSSALSGISGLSGLVGSVSGVFDGVRTSLEAWQQNLSSKTLMNIAISIAILAASLVVLSLIDFETLSQVLGVITTLFLELIGAQAAFNKIGGMGSKTAIGLIGMSTSLLILSGALALLSSIDPQSLNASMNAYYGLLAAMAAFTKVMGTVKTDLVKSGLGMIAVAVSMLLLAEVAKKLADISPEKLTNGLIGVGVMLAEIAAFIRLLDGQGVTKSLGLLVLAGSILVLGIAVEKLGKLDTNVLQQGLVAIGAVLGGIAAFTKITGNGMNLIGTSVGIIVLGVALEILTDVIQKLGGLSLEQLAKGLGGMGLGLLIIAGAMRLMPKGMIIQAVSLVIVSGALLILANAVNKLADLSWEEVARGLLAMAGALAIITLGLYAMSGTVGGSIAMLIAAAALTVMAGVMERFGAMPLEEIGRALLALAGIFLVLGIAGLLLTPVIPTLLGLGGSMLLIGLGAALVGAGLMLFASGLMLVAAGGATAGLGIAAFVTTILGLLPAIVTILIDTLIAFTDGIGRLAPSLFAALTVLVNGILQVIIDVSPKLFEALGVLLTGLINLINEYAPALIECLVTLLIALLETISSHLPAFLKAGIDIIIKLLEGIRDNIARVVSTAVEVITAFIGAISEQLPVIIQAGVDLIIAFIGGLETGIANNSAALLTAIGGLAASLIDGLVTGIASGASLVIDAIVKLAEDAIAAAWAAFDSNSPSEEFIRLARTVPEGIVVGLKKYGHRAVEGMSAFGNEVVGAASIINSAITDDDFYPMIRPVVDMNALDQAVRSTKQVLSGVSLNLARAFYLSLEPNRGLEELARGKEVPESGQNGTYITFQQTNNSPEALDRVEIYRQTNNQLLQIRGLGV